MVCVPLVLRLREAATPARMADPARASSSESSGVVFGGDMGGDARVAGGMERAGWVDAGAVI